MSAGCGDRNWAGEMGQTGTFVMFNKEKGKVLPLGRNKPSLYWGHPAGWKSSLAGKDLGVLVDTRLKVSEQVEGGDPFPPQH